MPPSPLAKTAADSAASREAWFTPGSPLFFVDSTGVPKTDEELCRQMKRFGQTADGFVAHIKDDHGGIQFIAAAYVGDRALGPQGLKDHGVVAMAPPGSQPELTQIAREWVAAMGGKYVGDPDCGCVMPRIRLRIQHRSADDTSDQSSKLGYADFAGDVDFEVALTLLELEGAELWYRGETSLVRSLQVTFRAPVTRASASQAEEWQFTARIDPATNLMPLMFGMTSSDEQGTVTFPPVDGYVRTLPLRPSIFTGLEELVMPLDSGATKTATLANPQRKALETLRVTVLVAPGK